MSKSPQNDSPSDSVQTNVKTQASSSWLKPSLDWLLIFVPIAIAMRFIPSLDNPTWLFIVSCIAIIPLAGWMGKATEHLAERLGEGIGGLLNATFGNAAELIIALFALSKGLEGVVKASITGSIIGNLLLVLGLSLLSGGVKFKEQKFNRTAASMSATALTLAAIALLVPSIFHIVAAQVPVAAGGWTPAKEQSLSLAIAIVLIVTYGFTLLFSLVTHKKLFVGEAMQGAAKKVGHELEQCEDKDDKTHKEVWSRGKSITVLLVATAFVALISEFLVGAIEQARGSLGLTEVFVGVIVVAIIGNAAEHSSAILMAMRNKMDLSLSIAMGSSLQIALFVAPVLMFASYLFGRPMSLEFTIPEVVAVIASILIAQQISSDGESNWVEGVQLLSVYAVLAILFYFLPDVHTAATETINSVAPAAASHP
ncbi:MAG TPA: calcium/proton exchanger [Pyrinomonadaceae bacterium]|nr:calcium/proton exchanger [Pyrinomonadaceae bacterium]